MLKLVPVACAFPPARLPSGCLAPISLPTEATEALKKATRLVVSASSPSSGEAATFNVSLNGFSAAIARVALLGG